MSLMKLIVNKTYWSMWQRLCQFSLPTRLGTNWKAGGSVMKLRADIGAAIDDSGSDEASEELFGNIEMHRDDAPLENNNKHEEELRDNNVVRYRGVSVKFLQELKEDILLEKIGLGVQLLLIKQDVWVETLQGVRILLKVGSTVRLKVVLRDGTMKCRTPYSEYGIFELKGDDCVYQIKSRHEWTVEDVCEYIVLENCRDETSFYLDLLHKQDVGKRFQGCFVSQARKSSFVDLIEALLNHYESANLAEQFVWLDIFSVNQPLLTSRDHDLPEDVQNDREELLKHGLHDAIEKFDERVVFFNSWLNPYPLERAWCVWEIFGCVKSKMSLKILFRPDEHKSFVDTLLQDREEVTKQIANVRLEDAECFMEKDKIDIDKAVEEEIGYHKLNVAISNQIIEWMRKFVQAIIDENRGIEDEFRFAKILHECGIFLRDLSGAHDEAMLCFEECLQILRRIHKGNGNELVAATLSEIATVWYNEAHYGEALEKFQQVLQIEEKMYDGRNNCEVATTLNNIGMVLLELGESDAALEHYEEALCIQEAVHGTRNHQCVAMVLNNLGLVLRRKRDYKAALKMHTEALKIYKDEEGWGDHPYVANTMNNLAMNMQDMGQYEEASLLLLKVLRMEEKLYGGQTHPRLLTTLKNIGLVFENAKDYDRALGQFQKVFQIYKGIDSDDRDIAASLKDMGRIYLRMEDYEHAFSKFKEALEIQKNIYDSEKHPDIIDTLTWMDTVIGEYSVQS